MEGNFRKSRQKVSHAFYSMSSAMLILHAEITWIFPVSQWMDGIFIAGVVFFPKAGSMHLVMEDMSERSCLQLRIIGTTRLMSSKKSDYYNSSLLSPGSRLWAHLWNQVIKFTFAIILQSSDSLLFSRRYTLTKQNNHEGFASKGYFKQVVWRCCSFS